MNNFSRTLRQYTGRELTAGQPQIIQANLGYLCNLSCRHCHVGGGPGRKEVMSWATMQEILRFADRLPGATLDLTGGAPEMNPDFRPLVESGRAQGHPVQVRTNLSVFFESGLEWLPDFLCQQKVQLVASLPCYLGRNVDAQRGDGVYAKSIEAIRLLNSLGYGKQADLVLNLVYNPGGPTLPPGQESLEKDYRSHLAHEFGISFTRLLTITNMPIGRFLAVLQNQSKEDEYRQLLEESFNPDTLAGLMCRHQICIAWDGTLSDCDFNQVLGLGLDEGRPQHISEINPEQLSGRPIMTGRHCFGCTAGCGSSCGGALVA